MSSKSLVKTWSLAGFLVALMCVAALPAAAQSFRVQCPDHTISHPDKTRTSVSLWFNPNTSVNGSIKCQQISGGDGYATMGDGTQTYLFSFGPLSGLTDIASGLPGTQFPTGFNALNTSLLVPGDPATTVDGGGAFSFNGAVGQVPDQDNGGAINGHVDPRQIMDIGVMNGNIPAPLMAIDEDDEFFLTLTNVGMIMRPDLFEQHTVHFHGYPNASAFYDGVPDASVAINIGGSFTYYYLAPDAGTYFWHCHITPPEHLQMGMVGQLYVRPRQNRLLSQATIGLPPDQTLYDGLSDMNRNVRTACRRPNDNVSDGSGNPIPLPPVLDILCSNPLPSGDDNNQFGGFVLDSGNVAVGNGSGHATKFFAYNDGDGTTAYDVEYPLQIHGFDPNFHFVGMTFNPEGFADMKDKYFLLNGRSYPDTVKSGTLETQSADGVNHFSQPLPAIINIPSGGRALLRISDLDVSEYQTLASLGIPMQVVGYNAKLLRDQAGNNLYYTTNSITLGGGESLDVILDATGIPAGTYYLYTPNLDHLSNDAENFGGLMTEVHVCSSTVTGGNTFGNACSI